MALMHMARAAQAKTMAMGMAMAMGSADRRAVPKRKRGIEALESRGGDAHGFPGHREGGAVSSGCGCVGARNLRQQRVQRIKKKLILDDGRGFQQGEWAGALDGGLARTREKESD